MFDCNLTSTQSIKFILFILFTLVFFFSFLLHLDLLAIVTTPLVIVDLIPLSWTDVTCPGEGRTH
jgi:hypothetical protein